MTPFVLAPRDPRLDAVLAEAGLADGLFDARQHESCERVEQYVLRLAVDLAGTLGVADLLHGPTTVEALLAARGFVAGFARALTWLLDRLALAGLVVRDPAGAYRLAGPLPAPDLAAARAAGLAGDASYAPVYALLDEAAAIYPRVARGETTGEAALFRKVGLWVGYFSNANAYYALNNRVVARVAERRLPARGARIVEVGAGLGSATEALLGSIGPGAIAAYRVTEPVVFFRHRAARTLAAAHPGVPLAFAALDLNAPWAGQGVPPASADLVWGVNVLHLARDLDAALGEARATLAPGGWLVVGEGVRPVAGQPVGAEFPFQILESFVDVVLDPRTRPSPGFLTAEQWRAAFERAGLVDIDVVPDVIRLRAIYPGFFAAAICGRRA